MNSLGSSKNWSIFAKMGYNKIIEDKKLDNLKSWWVSLWKLNAPPRTRLLMWNILENKVPTGSLLKKRAFSGPSRCVMCLQAEESTQHLFLSCPTTRTIWAQVIQSLDLNADWQGVDINSAWEQWWNTVAAEKPRNLPLLVSWYIWVKRNAIIFENNTVDWNLLHPIICAAYTELPNEISQKQPRNIIQEKINKDMPWAYFDGAAQQQGCGGASSCIYPTRITTRLVWGLVPDQTIMQN